VGETLEAWKARYRAELLEASRVVKVLRLEEEARRRGALFGKGEVPHTSRREDPRGGANS
jgi:hypothetical protein